MSKSAAKYIRSATSGRTTDLLLDVLYSPDVRKNWRNADVLARFLVDTVANAYECENSTTLADNGYDSMEDAISGYVEANLGDWDQAKFLASTFGQRTAQEIADRLAEAVFKNVAFEVKQKATMTTDQKAALAEGVDQFRETQCQAFLAYWRETCDVTTTLLTANRVWCQMRDEANKMNEAWHLAQPCSAARNNAHYYQLLVAKRQRQGYVAMTECHLAYQYILNDAIAGDMVKSCDVYRLEILMRDGSWFQLVETMTTDITPHGFYVKTQDKLA